MEGSIVIDCFPESAHRYRSDSAIVVVDVIRATTTVTTAISKGIRVFPVSTTDEAFVLASTLENPLLVGELGGNVPYGFDLTNSPVVVSELDNNARPIIFISSSGSQLLRNASGAEAIYLCCLRNFDAVARYMAGKHRRIAIIGAGTRGQFRREDQLACGWLGEKLLSAGYKASSQLTKAYVSRWTGVDVGVIREGRSAEYLRKSGQEGDLEFILTHIDDLDTVPCLVDGEIISAPLSAGDGNIA